ncbi:homing endonuclease associated repeat-containing protein [Dyadobacter bucti]|uniref:homing endonuclease associated repeat-containing protein n=1 Tax=Dyadobacter bucti TaxID=2572203 RepID=UPI003F70EDB0
MDKFYYQPPKSTPVLSDVLIEDLRFVAKQLNVTRVSQETYQKHGKFSTSLFKRRFGSWNKALLEANLEIVRVGIHTEEALFENILKVWQKKGGQPTQSDMDDASISNITSGVYKKRFKGWTNAVKDFIRYANENYVITAKKKEEDKRDPSVKLRYQVLKRDNFSCVQCGASPAKGYLGELHIDHIKAWSKGGKTEIINLQTLCVQCNLGKSNLD